jgi:hypothetical protein
MPPKFGGPDGVFCRGTARRAPTKNRRLGGWSKYFVTFRAGFKGLPKPLKS